ncbi:MAG: phytanoyl-CoA dioxygenase family protein, partial [Steroidobacteraceae bacterium]
GMRLTPDMTASVIRPELKQAFGFPMNYVLFEDPIFQEALLNPIGLALTTYLLGQNALLSSASILVKGPGGLDLPLHADSFRMPDPLPHLPQICNITWALTDYSYDNGALAVVPGSHRYLRRPLHNEGIAQRVAVEAPAGSMIVWGGQLWHGAFARKNPGFRATLTFYMCRPHMTTQEAYGECVPKDVIDRNPPRMAVLLGQRMNYGWREAGPTLATGVDEGAPNSFAMGRHAYD